MTYTAEEVAYENYQDSSRDVGACVDVLERNGASVVIQYINVCDLPESFFCREVIVGAQFTFELSGGVDMRLPRIL